MEMTEVNFRGFSQIAAKMVFGPRNKNNRTIIIFFRFFLPTINIGMLLFLLEKEPQKVIT